MPAVGHFVFSLFIILTLLYLLAYQYCTYHSICFRNWLYLCLSFDFLCNLYQETHSNLISDSYRGIVYLLFIWIEDYVVQCVPLASEPGWLADRCSVSQQLGALQTHATDTFLFISHTTNVLLFKFLCNIFIGVRIIKEMPGSVASGTHYIIVRSWRIITKWISQKYRLCENEVQEVAPKRINLHAVWKLGCASVIHKMGLL